MNKNQWKPENICLNSHGEDDESWMSNPIFYIIGGIRVLAAVLAVLSFYVFHVAVLGVNYWGTVYNYCKALYKKNASSEGVAFHCVF